MIDLNVLKGKSFTRIIKGGIKYVKSMYGKFTLYISRPACKGITESDNVEIVVSLTSFPERINTIHLCVKTLLNQTYKPDRVLLWLAKSQFPNQEEDLPKALLKLKKNGLSICWCDDIRSYKKLIPAIEKYPDSAIITTDDDVYYGKNWLKGLVDSYKEHPEEIICYRAAKIEFDNGRFIRDDIQPYSEYKDATYLHQQTGVGGVLYPPHSLYKDILRRNAFMQLAPTNDDLWFWLMAVLNGRKIRILQGNTFKLYYIGETQKFSLTSINDHGEKLYYNQLEAIFEAYPKALSILKKEYDCMEKNS